MVKERLWWKIRGLYTMEERFNSPICKFIKERLKSQKNVRVLEIGFGEGRCLLDLRQIFPGKKVILYGINEKKCGDMHSKSDFIRNAKRFKIKINKNNLPKPYFYDAGKGLKFKKDYFDLIISQVAFHYIDDKARLIEDIWRVLKPGGRAFIHIDNYKKNYPDFMQLNKETPRFLIYKRNKVIKLSDHLKRFRGYCIKVKISNKSNQTNLVITKNNTKKLDLGLSYDKNSTLYLTLLLKFPKIYDIDAGIWWGTRSVFYAKK